MHFSWKQSGQYPFPVCLWKNVFGNLDQCLKHRLCKYLPFVPYQFNEYWINTKTSVIGNERNNFPVYFYTELYCSCIFIPFMSWKEMTLNIAPTIYCMQNFTVGEIQLITSPYSANCNTFPIIPTSTSIIMFTKTSLRSFIHYVTYSERLPFTGN